MLSLWTRTNHGLVLLLWWFVIKEFGWQRILGKWHFLWRNKWNFESHNFRILKKWFERNDDFFFSHKNYLQKQPFTVRFKKFVLKNLSLFTRKHLKPWRPATIIKKRLQNWCFSCDYWAIFKNTFFTAHFRWLLVYTEWMNFLCVYFWFTWPNCCVTQSSASAHILINLLKFNLTPWFTFYGR